jgi:hypothetical protein
LKFDFGYYEDQYCCVIYVENDIEKKVIEKFIPTLNNLINELITSLKPILKNGTDLQLKTITVEDLVPNFKQSQVPRKRK